MPDYDDPKNNRGVYLSFLFFRAWAVYRCDEEVFCRIGGQVHCSQDITVVGRRTFGPLALYFATVGDKRYFAFGSRWIEFIFTPLDITYDHMDRESDDFAIAIRDWQSSVPGKQRQPTSTP